MKQFFGAFFGSIVGIIVAFLLGALIIALVAKAAVGAFKDKDEAGLLKESSVLRLEMSGELLDREQENPFREFTDNAPFIAESGSGLNSLLKKISRAKTDDNVKGIYLAFGKMDAGYAALFELRSALEDFRKSGKFIYTYADDFSQKQYFLASVADKIYLNPEGFFEWKGLHMNMMFLKGTFDKLELEMQVFRHGKFKSAVEPFTADRMSPENRLQSEAFLGSMWETMLAAVAQSRKLDVAELNRMADELTVRFPEDALGKLVDVAGYEDEVFSEIKKKLGMAEKDKLKFVEMSKYSARPLKMPKPGAGKIAVIYAIGSINQGEGSDDEIGSDRIARAIREARLDDKIKAIVLRVNSPGGSAIASEVIWREMVLARKAKPTVVSMGNVAASGGYYISCPAQRIFAQPNTITGSIGVFGIIPNAQKMFRSKLGITFDTVNTNRHSDAATGLRSLNVKESAFIQGLIERIYTTFTQRVAEGRGIPQPQVDSIAQGRVWSGTDALKINLVDEIGGLNDAIAWAAKTAKLDEYRITELPVQKGPFAGLFGDPEKVATEVFVKQSLGENYKILQQVREVMKMKGVQARMIFDPIIE